MALILGLPKLISQSGLFFLNEVSPHALGVQDDDDDDGLFLTKGSHHVLGYCSRSS